MALGPKMVLSMVWLLHDAVHAVSLHAVLPVLDDAMVLHTISMA